MEYLAHYGIAGMKWGRRRYQNEDGSLTTKTWSTKSKVGGDIDGVFGSYGRGFCIALQS